MNKTTADDLLDEIKLTKHFKKYNESNELVDADDEVAETAVGAKVYVGDVAFDKTASVDSEYEITVHYPGKMINEATGEITDTELSATLEGKLTLKEDYIKEISATVVAATDGETYTTDTDFTSEMVTVTATMATSTDDVPVTKTLSTASYSVEKTSTSSTINDDKTYTATLTITLTATSADKKYYVTDKDGNALLVGDDVSTTTAKVDVKPMFTSFDAGNDINKKSDSSDWEKFTATDNTWSVTNAKFQKTQPLETSDYTTDPGSGYSYASRVKFKGTGEFTINTKAGVVLRIDGGNANGADKRTVTITGADETSWEATTMGSFYLTATDATVVLGSATNEFCIYGIHIVNEKVATTSKTEATYSKPTVTLSATSCIKDAEVTVTTTIPDASVKTTYSDGKVVNSTQAVTAEVSYSGATVTEGKVSTATAGTYSITASYTVGETTYTSDAVTLEVAGAFEAKTETITNDTDTLGLTATTVSSSDTGVATVVLDGGIKITSVAAGTATITFGDGTKSGTIDVTVGAGGDITATVNKHSSVNLTILDWEADEAKTDTTTFAKGTAAKWNGLNVIALANAVTETSSGLSISNCRFDIGSDSDKATTNTDTSVAGDIKFVDGYDIKVTVSYTSELANSKSNGAFQIFLDNNTGTASKSLLGNSSKLSNAGTVPQTTSTTIVNTIDCSAIQAAYDAITTATVTGHYIVIRADSGCAATVTAIKIEYVAAAE